MCGKLSLVFAMILCGALEVAAQQTSLALPKDFKSEQLIPVEGDIHLRVFISKTRVFDDVAVEGVPLVITLEFSDPVQKHSEAHYLLLAFNRDKPESSKVTLSTGMQRILPIALFDGFPDPTGRMPEIKDRKASAKLRTAVYMKTIIEGTPAKPFISFLFDVPAEASKVEKKLFLTLIKQEIIVSLGK